MAKKKTLIFSTPRQAVVFYPFRKREGFGAGAGVLLSSLNPLRLIKEVSATLGTALSTDRIIATEHVLETSYSKAKVSVSGTFTVLLDSTKNWTSRIRPGDWVMLYQSQTQALNIDSTKGLICLGNIDRVSKVINISKDGKKTIRYKIEGRDFGKIFEKTKFYYNPYTRNKEEVKLFVLSKVGIKVLGSPTDFLRTFFNIFFGSGDIIVNGTPQERIEEFKQLQVPDAIYKVFGVGKETKQLSDIVRIRIGSNLVDEIDQSDPLLPEGFSYYVAQDKVVNENFWDLLMSTANLAVNELYTTMEYYPREDKMFPTITLRKIPFRQNIFQKLDKIKIFDMSIIKEDVGFSDHERYNYINLIPTATEIADNYSAFLASIQDKVINPAGELTPLFPYIDKDSISKYGFNQLELTTDFLFTPQQSSLSNSETEKRELDKDRAKRWQKELIEIWGNMHRQESGTVGLKGFYFVARKELGERRVKKLVRDNLVPGQNIQFLDKGKLFHLEGFTRTWTRPGNLDITITLSRGVSWDGRRNYKFLDEVEDLTQREVSSSFVRKEK